MLLTADLPVELAPESTVKKRDDSTTRKTFYFFKNFTCLDKLKIYYV